MILFNQPHKREQNYFQSIIELLFSQFQITCDVRKATSLRYPTGTYFEIDIWIPDLNLGFEYQEKHHYGSTWYTHNTLQEIKGRDEMKANTMDNKGFTLIAIPYWWRNESRLIATIQICAQRLENFYTNSSSISHFPPPNISKAHSIPDVGELMKPTFMESSSFDPSNWWMGEKFEGERGCWNPKYPALFSRKAKQLVVPIKIKQKIPLIFLDGELWFGRGTFNQEVTTSKASKKWEWFKFITFDNPESTHHGTPFENRGDLPNWC